MIPECRRWKRLSINGKPRATKCITKQGSNNLPRPPWHLSNLTSGKRHPSTFTRGFTGYPRPEGQPAISLDPLHFDYRINMESRHAHRIPPMEFRDNIATQIAEDLRDGASKSGTACEAVNNINYTRNPPSLTPSYFGSSPLSNPDGDD